MNPDIVLPLDKMTVAEKLEVLDLVWNDLNRRPEDIPPPAWHGAYLRKTEEEIANGTAKFIDIEEAEESLRKITP